MKYIKDLNIRRFRGIKDLELKDLGQVNILVGQNNSGKTSILEAICVLGNPTKVGYIINIGAQREIFLNMNPFYIIFNNMLNSSSNSISILANIKGKAFEINIAGEKVYLLSEDNYSKNIEGFRAQVNAKYEGEFELEESTIIYHSHNDFIMNNEYKILDVEFISPSEHLMQNNPSEIIKKGKKNALIQLLRIFDKDIIGLEMIQDNKTIPYIEHRKLGLMPLSTYGDGVKKVLLLGSSIIEAENGVLLIDEVETGIHNEALVDVFKWFIKACKKYKVQVFMTTHSLEVIDAILDSQKDSDNEEFLRDSLRVITIKNSTDSEKTRVRNIDGLRAYEARENYDLELRG